MRHIKIFEEYDLDKKQFIESIIDQELEKSAEFGLDIEPDDVKKEKELFVDIFTKWWDDIKDCRSNREYLDMNTNIYKYIFSKLEDRAKYYFTKSKTMYQCHISAVNSSLFMRINNL